MKIAMRIGILLIAIVGLTVSNLTDIRPSQAISFCDGVIWEGTPSGYEFVSIIVCNDEKYELWRNPVTNAYIRRPIN